MSQENPPPPSTAKNYDENHSIDDSQSSSYWNSLSGYVDNIQKEFTNVANDASKQYDKFVAMAVTQKPEQKQPIPSALSSASPIVENHHHHNQGGDHSIGLDNNMIQNTISPLESISSTLKNGMNYYLYNGMHHNNRMSFKTTSTAQVRSSLLFFLKQQEQQQNQEKERRRSHDNNLLFSNDSKGYLQQKSDNDENEVDSQIDSNMQDTSYLRSSSSLSAIGENNNENDNSIIITPTPSFGEQQSNTISGPEAASHLAQGTIRALRDLILEEALELNEALRFWSERWEKPYLSYLEAIPNIVWKFLYHLFKTGGDLAKAIDDSIGSYDHLDVGRKVSQIQAVLARRCAAIGELQEHLLRAGWERGIANWGVLGLGDQWSTFIGNGSIPSSSQNPPTPRNNNNFQILPHSSLVGAAKEQKDYPDSQDYGRASIFVRNKPGGKIILSNNDFALLTAWSIDGMRLIRDQLYRARGVVSFRESISGRRIIRPLPYYNNWPQEKLYFDDNENYNSLEENTSSLPLWAVDSDEDYRFKSRQSKQDLEIDNGYVSESSSPFTIDIESQLPLPSSRQSNHHAHNANSNNGIIIKDITLMSEEVSELLTTMEIQMQQQKNRRLLRLKPTNKITRNWYRLAFGIPPLLYIGYTLKGNTIKLAKDVLAQIKSFYAEHFSGPIQSIYSELIKGRTVNITDQKARMNAIDSLKKMIKNWLDQVYPLLPEADRMKMSQDMDISLIELRKENSLNNNALYEIQDIVRMSFIEMQFIKKELLNAMSAIDDLMDSNEINMHLGAILPAVMVVYISQKLFRLIFYAFLKLGKSRDDVYASLQQIILDIERLLVMRDDPPPAPAPLSQGIISSKNNNGTNEETTKTTEEAAEVTPQSKNALSLSSDDLGMLMLLVHECRSILWKYKRRFSDETIRNITEDFLELTGERGNVSVKQQLSVIHRMCRTYGFLNKSIGYRR